PLVRDFARPEIISRATGVGLFADTGPLERINEQRSEHANYQGLTTKILHNKPINYGLAFLENWVQHYHGEFLFLSGDEIQRNKVPETGQMYIFYLLFLVTGLIFLLRPKGVNPCHPAGVKIIIWWLIVAPIAAALTFQSPHALRAQNMVIPLVIIAAFGLMSISTWILENVKKKVVVALIFVGFTAIVAWNFTRYLHMYWVHMAQEYPFSSQYGIKGLVNYVNENESKFDKVIISDKYDQPYILFLFYSKYSPIKFQESHELTERDQYGFSTVRFIDKYEFRQVNFDVDKPENPRSMIVGADVEISDEANIVKEIYGINGYKYFDVVAN
ncbi:hypothetical protein KKB40_06210, partial [Patescibacteria group bacterium]|nr:hypothetical protein [Patescibacteria group bacterium]